MATNATAVWRARPAGNNNNGGGFDCAISSAATGTHGSFSGTTFTDAVANAFTSGMVGSSINITGIGQYKITAFVNASNITLGSGNPGLPLSSGMSWTVGSGQDYSQQNAAQVTQSGGTVTTSTTTLTDTGASFTSALIGNAIRVAGTGITTTYTYITAVPSSTTLTLQTSPGTAGSAVTYNIGGAWADFWTNAVSSIIANGNTVYILGSGTPNPASYTYDYNQTAQLSFNFGPLIFANDPATPGYKAPPDTTGGMPVIRLNLANNGGIFGAGAIASFAGLWFVGTATAATKYALFGTSTDITIYVFGCVMDQFGIDIGFVAASSTATYEQTQIVGCEVFSSVVAGTGSTPAITNNINAGGLVIDTCNLHDCISTGIVFGAGIGGGIQNCIIAKCQGDGIFTSSSGGTNCNIKGNTIDGNAGNGINCGAFTAAIINNIISNHTTGGKVGLNLSSLTSPFFIDYNVFYNNATDISGVRYGPHDTHGGGNPYVNQATEDYTLA